MINKKLLIIVFVVVLLIIGLKSCGGGLKKEIRGTYASDNYVAVIDKNSFTMYQKGDPENPTYYAEYKIVSEQKDSNKLVVDTLDEDGEKIDREIWYKTADDEIVMLEKETGEEFNGYSGEEGLDDYKPADFDYKEK